VRARFTIAVAAAVALLGARAIAQQPWRFDGAERVVAIADVHGAYAELVALLQATAILDAELRWSGGDSLLVSLGDLVDRGAQSREVLDLLMRLQREAAVAGGAVHVVLGNHEAMTLLGDLRYVAPADYAEFAAEEPAALRAEVYERFRADNPALEPDIASASFEQRFPPGYFARQQAFAPNGRYGSWLLALPSIVVIGDTAFVHGGLPKLVASTAPEELNERNRRALRAAASPPAGDSTAPALEGAGLGEDGPLWYRGSVYCKPIIEEPVLDAALANLRAARVVVGHTPTEDRRVHELYGGKLLMLDTGMLAQYYGGRPAALIVENGAARVRYLGALDVVAPDAGPRALAYGLTEAELSAALAAAEIVEVERGAARGGLARVRLRAGQREIEAEFYPSDEDRAAEHELAAHAIDRMLGSRLVPLTVGRRGVEGRDGALQIAYPDAVSETVRVERRIELAAWCALDPQVALLQAFDALIGNAGRSRDNVLFRPEIPDLQAVDHRRAFAVSRGLPPSTPALEPALRAALASLDAALLEQQLGAWLDGSELRALLARRDALLERAAAPSSLHP
jgi:Calcineurin-like phosphoesterase